MSAIDPTGKVAASGNITEQTQIMMNQLEKALSLFDSRPENVLKLNYINCWTWMQVSLGENPDCQIRAPNRRCK